MEFNGVFHTDKQLCIYVLNYSHPVSCNFSLKNQNKSEMKFDKAVDWRWTVLYKKVFLKIY